MNIVRSASIFRAVLFLAILLSFGACDAKTQSGHDTADASPRRMSSKDKSPTLFFDLPLGTSYQEVVEQMGHPQVDHGSGVEIPEYCLLPSGSAVVFCDTDHAVHLVFVSWGSEQDGTTFAAWPDITRGPDLSSLETEHAGVALSPERVDPRLLLGVKRGMSISDMRRQIGLRPDTAYDGQSVIKCRLEPHGIATVGVQENRLVSDVSLLWWRGE